MTKFENYKIVFVNEYNKDNIEDCDIYVILSGDKKSKYNNVPITAKFVVGFPHIKQNVRMPLNCEFMSLDPFGTYFFSLPEKCKLNADTGDKELDSKIKFRAFKQEKGETVTTYYEYRMKKPVWKLIYKANQCPYLPATIILSESDYEN